MEKSKLEFIMDLNDEELAQMGANATANFQEDIPEKYRRIDLDTLVTVQIEQVIRQASQ
jgi:hypothetical protein